MAYIPESEYPFRKPDGFTSDGCSGFLSDGWRIATNGEAPPFECCCIWHDLEYEIGGSLADRLEADIDLFNCAKKYSFLWACILFVFVRAFGAFNFVWHWNHKNYDLEELVKEFKKE